MMLQNATQTATTVSTTDLTTIIALVLGAIGTSGTIIQVIRFITERQKFSVEIMESEHHTHRLWVKIRIINAGGKNTTVEAPTLKIFDNDREIEGRCEGRNWKGEWEQEQVFPLRIEMEDIKDNISLQYEFDVALPNNNLDCQLNAKYTQDRKKGVNTDFISRYTEDIYQHQQSLARFSVEQ